MPLWGKKDTVYSTGKVDCTTAGVITRQAGTIAWTAANGVKVGQVVTLATDGAGPGQGIIKSIDTYNLMSSMSPSFIAITRNKSINGKQKRLYSDTTKDLIELF